MSASPASLPVRASPSSTQTLVRNNASLMSNLAVSSTILGLQGGAFLGIGLYALAIGGALLFSGGTAAIPLGFYGAIAAGTSAGGALALGTGFSLIGATNLIAAHRLRGLGR